MMMDEIDNNNGELFRYFGDSAALSSRVETESHLACWAVWVVGSLWPETGEDGGDMRNNTSYYKY